MALELGAGIALDENLDFAIDNTGDLKASYAFDELEKDLSFKMIINLSQFLGRPPTPTVEAEIRNIARRVALADVRVTSVPDGSIDVSFDESLEQMDVSMSIIVAGAEQRLVFTV